MVYINRQGIIMVDFRDAKSADILYDVGNVFVPLQQRICDTN